MSLLVWLDTELVRKFKIMPNVFCPMKTNFRTYWIPNYHSDCYLYNNGQTFHGELDLFSPPVHPLEIRKWKHSLWCYWLLSVIELSKNGSVRQ